MQPDYTLRLLRVADFIADHLTEELNPLQLAKVAGLSQYHFHRVFRGMTGESVMGYIRRLRLEKAARKLKYSNLAITDLAFESGYASHEAFTRAFANHFGRAPSTYRSEQQRDQMSQVQFSIKELPARRLVGRRHIGPYGEVGDSWQLLLSWAADEGLISSTLETIGICHDDPDITAPQAIRYDSCITVPNHYQPNDPMLRLITLPAGRYAVAQHLGPYEKITGTYYALFGSFVPHKALDLADEPPFEVYWNSPEDTDPEELDTDICVRIC